VFRSRPLVPSPPRPLPFFQSSISQLSIKCCSLEIYPQSQSSERQRHWEARSICKTGRIGTQRSLFVTGNGLLKTNDWQLKAIAIVLSPTSRFGASLRGQSGTSSALPNGVRLRRRVGPPMHDADR